MKRIILALILALFVLPISAHAQQTWDSGVVRVYVGGQNVYTAQVWAPCPSPLQQFQCPERLNFPDFWVRQLATYEALEIACQPSSTGQAGRMCYLGYMYYASYLHPFIDSYPGVFVLQPPKPLPQCLDLPEIGFTCPATTQRVR